MKVFLCADIEGCAGFSFIDELLPGGDGYEYFRRQLGKEVYYSCLGALDAGAEKVLVRDSHYLGKNIIPTDLPKDERVFLSRGVPHDLFVMLGGIQDDDYDAAIFIATHCGGFSAGSNVSHTFTADVESLKINGVEMSEFLFAALCAAYNGVPCAFVAGDKTACEEAEQLLPGIKTYSTFELGGGRAVVSQHPDIVAETLRGKVKEALESDFSGLLYPLPDSFELEIRFHAHARAFNFSFYPGAERIDYKTIRLCSNDFLDILRLIHFSLIPLRTGEFEQSI